MQNEATEPTFAIVRRSDTASRIRKDLVRSGFNAKDIAFVESDEELRRRFAACARLRAAKAAAGGALAGLVSGAAVACAAVLMGAVAAEWATLVALTAIVTAAGALVGGLGAWMAQRKARRYADSVADGGLIVAVRAHDESERSTMRRVLAFRGAIRLEPKSTDALRQAVDRMQYSLTRS